VGAPCQLRVGLGYDIHRLVEGRPLILGGVRFQSPRGLLGHSDADVICHALADALLGAANLGDIGQHFPPSDPKWKNANSLGLLEKVRELLAEKAGKLVNADLTVVAEEPRISPKAAEMKDLLARALGTSPDRISIKATTNEGLGPEGRGEAISASAICLVAFGDA
jgi:2-C-methyl-D-erythritol 2,4-cyclodiphosphate synthase